MSASSDWFPDFLGRAPLQSSPLPTPRPPHTTDVDEISTPFSELSFVEIDLSTLEQAKIRDSSWHMARLRSTTGSKLDLIWIALIYFHNTFPQIVRRIEQDDFSRLVANYGEQNIASLWQECVEAEDFTRLMHLG